MKKILLKRTAVSFGISALCGLIVNLLIEFAANLAFKNPGTIPLSPEFEALFPSHAIAVEVNVLLYGVIGGVFAAATFLYEKEQIGFVLQNLLYFLLTGAIWVPIVIFLWQLQKYPIALYYTLGGYGLTYFIMTIVGYRMIKRDVGDINRLILQKNQPVG